MSLTASPVLRRARATLRVVREDLQDLARTRLRPISVELDPRQRQALVDLRRDGFAIVESYWDRPSALALGKRLERYLEQQVDRDFENGAYLRFQDNAEYDQGVRRIYHVDRLVPKLQSFRRDPFVLGVVAAYYRMPFFSGLLLYQYNTKSNTNTRYHHVDSFAKEAKAFLYLDDVDPGNGPFTYLRGSHRRHFMRLRKQIAGNRGSAATSFTPRDVSRILERETQVCGRAGTLILSDVRGLHRGSPQVDRSRSVIVNYLHRQELELYPAR